MLGNLLRSDQFPEWLEAAALDTLVADAVGRLSELSNGQFELDPPRGRVLRRRPRRRRRQRRCRTLSGGETFQASLALALALCSPAVVDGGRRAAAGSTRSSSTRASAPSTRRRWRSSPPRWRTCAQGDRMVGVVTHVAALAERVPVRFVVNRDSRTSSHRPGDRMTGTRVSCGVRGMSFSVDGWDPAYGTSLELEDDLGESTAEVDVGVDCRAAVAADRPAGKRCCRPVRRSSSTASGGSRPGSGSTRSAAERPARPRRPRRSAPPTRPGWSAAATAGRTCSPRRPARAVHRRAARRGHRHLRRGRTWPVHAAPESRKCRCP